MKINFKNIIIIFLVALLGAGLGTFGVLGFYKTNNSQIKEDENYKLNINEVTYSKKDETNYSHAIDIAYDTVVEIETTIITESAYNYFFYGGGSSTSTASGSGVIVSDDGYIVTNEHVIRNASGEDAVKITLFDGNEYIAKIIGSDTRTDLALLKIDAHNLKYSSFADSSQLLMGEEVIAIGNPLGLGISCSNGIISALEKEIYINNVYLTVIQTNAEINGGNSGGGLFDLQGNLIGIVNAKTSNSYSTTTIEGMGYAIPSNTVKRIINDLKENGFVKDRAALGIRVYTNESYFSSNGVVVSDVVEGGSADKAGIKRNDVITEIDGSPVSSYADLSKALDNKNVGDVVTVRVIRDDSAKDFKVTLQQSSAE